MHYKQIQEAMDSFEEKVQQNQHDYSKLFKIEREQRQISLKAQEDLRIGQQQQLSVDKLEELERIAEKEHYRAQMVVDLMDRLHESGRTRTGNNNAPPQGHVVNQPMATAPTQQVKK